jgi:cytochrome c biogenesis protein ResB
MVGLKAASRQSDLTQKIDLNDERFKKGISKPRVALRFRKVRGLWTQVFYVFLGISLFFCAIRYVLEPKSFSGHVQRTVHSLLEKNPLQHVQGLLGIKPAATAKKPVKPPPKKVKKKKTRSRSKHNRAKKHQKPAST